MGSIKNLAPRAWRSRVERPALVFAVVGTALGLWLALRQRPLDLSQLQWPWLSVLLFAGVPLITLANALRMRLSFGLVGQAPLLSEVIRASVLSSVANLLPLPGGVLLRIAYLLAPEVSVRRATGVTFGVASVWFALAAIGSGVALTVLGDSWAGLALLGGGATLAVAGWIYLSRLPLGRRAYLQLLALETAVFAVQAFRFSWSLAALGYPATWLQGLALSVACVSGALVSIVPAGLGVLELSAAMIAPLAGLDPAATFLAVFLDRIATLLGLGLAAALLARRPVASPHG